MADSKGGEITGEQAHRGIAIVHWRCSSYMRLRNRDRMARKISQIQALRGLLLGTAEKEITLRDLANHHGIEHDEVHRLAVKFPDKLTIITRLLGANGGRPSDVVAVPRGNPDYDGEDASGAVLPSAPFSRFCRYCRFCSTESNKIQFRLPLNCVAQCHSSAEKVAEEWRIKECNGPRFALFLLRN